MKSIIALTLGLVISTAAMADQPYWMDGETLYQSKQRQVQHLLHKDKQRFNRAFLVASECRRLPDKIFQDRFESYQRAKKHVDALVNKVPYYGPADKNFTEIASQFYSPGPGSVELMNQHLGPHPEFVSEKAADIISAVREQKISFGEALRTYKSSVFVCLEDGDYDTMAMIQLDQLVEFFKNYVKTPGKTAYDVMVGDL